MNVLLMDTLDYNIPKHIQNSVANIATVWLLILSEEFYTRAGM